MVIDLLILAAATDSAPTIEGVFLSQGLIGAVALALAYFAISTIKELRARLLRLEEENRRLHEMTAEQYIPALTKSADAVAAATAIIGDIKKRDDIRAAVEAAREAARKDRDG
jgi:hypothetical protein